jgi:TP901 family phage tail tape measure protein
MVEASAEFRKAGFDDSQSAILAQTASLFQNVADEEVSAGDAANFLISQMTAFNIEASDTINIVDAINEVSNNFAVSSSQLSSGLSVVASSSAVMGNSMEETIALMTAMTEVTRNANKSSRGLNSIMVQLAEVLDSTSSTGQKITEIYRDLGISMYDSEGQLKSGYELLSALAEKWNELDSNSQKYIATTIATKTQMNNFVALMTNFEHATEATATALNSAGSAAEENARYMQGIEAHVQKLKATFEELATNVISSELIKSLLDLANSFLELVDTPIGRAITTVTLLSGLLLGLGSKVVTLGKHVVGLAKNFFTTTVEIDAATKATKTFANSTNIAIAPIGVAVTVIMAIRSAIIEAREAAIAAGVEAQNNLDTLNELSAQYEELTKRQTSGQEVTEELNSVTEQLTAHLEENGVQIDSFVEKYGSLADAIAAATEEELKRLEQDIIAARIAAEKELQRVALETEAIGSGSSAMIAADFATAGLTGVDKILAEYEYLYALQGELIDRGETTSHAYDSVAAALAALQPYVEQYNTALENEAALSGEASDGQHKIADGANKVADATQEAVDILNDEISTVDSLKESLGKLADAYEDFADNGKVSYSTLVDIAEAFSDVDGIDTYIDRLADAGLTSEELTQILSELAYAKADLILSTNGVSESSYNLVRAMLEEIGVVNADAVALDMCMQAALKAGNGLDFVRKYAELLSNTGLDVSSILAGLNKVANTAAGAYSMLYKLKVLAAGGSGAYFKEQYEETSPGSGIWVPKSSGIDTSIDFSGAVSGSSKGGGSSSTTDTQLEALKDIVSLRESELTVLEKQGKPISEQVAKNKEIQAALHNQAEYMRSVGASQEEINELSAKWWTIQNDINELLKDAMDAVKEGLEEQADNINDALSYAIKMAEAEIDNINDKYDQQLETLENSNDALERQITLEEKLKAIAEAKAKKLYVYKDGRFQYVDDVESISAAQQEYDEYKREQQFEEQQDAIEAARDAEIKIWQDYIDNWENVVDSYTNSQDKLLAEQVLGIRFEAENWAERLGNAQEFARQYSSIMSQIAQIESMQDAGQYVDLNTDYSALMDKATTAAEFNKYAALRDAKATALGIDISASGYRTSEEIRKSKGFAGGTLGAPGGLSVVGERGAELRVLNSGDGIIPADITRNLWAWGKLDPNTFSKNQNYTFNIDNLALPGVTNAQSFLTGLRQMAYQRAYGRA